MVIAFINDQDCINLSDVSYQNIEGFKRFPSLFDAFFNSTGGVKKELAKISKEFREFILKLETFSEYYIPTFKKYMLLDTMNKNKETGYYGAAFYNASTQTVVIANRGTEPKKDGGIDLYTDANIGLGRPDYQFINANEFYAQALDTAKINKLVVKHIYVTGHSLGGGLASVQFLTHYVPGGKLIGGTTFEAPGMERVYKYAHKISPMSEEEKQKTVQISSNPLGQAISLAFNTVAPPLHKFATMINEKYTKIRPQFSQMLIQYGIAEDWVYSTSNHIGTLKNPLGQSHIKIDQTILETFRKWGWFKTDVFHPLNSYKIYALDNNHNIVQGKMVTTNFLKYAIPLLIELKMNYEQVIIFLEQMYRFGFKTNMDIKLFMLEKYEGSKLLTNETILTDLRKYNELLDNLKGIMDVDYFITIAKEVLAANYQSLVPRPEKSEALKKFELSQKILDFEFRYNIHDVRKINSITEISPQACFPRNADELNVLEYIFKRNSDNAEKMQERAYSWAYYTRYEKFCKEHKDFLSRKHEIDSLLFRLKSEVEHCFI